MKAFDARTRERWRSWLAKHHDDSLIKRIDEDHYARKFTPRKPDSAWSTAIASATKPSNLRSGSHPQG